MRTLRNLRLAATLTLPLCCLSACKVSDDAAATAQQMTATAACLQDYYSALRDSVTNTIALYELDAAISGIPFNDADRKPIQDTAAAIDQRRQLASSLATLGASLSKLSKLTVSTDVASSATKLGNELIAVNALPKGSPVPAALGQAGNQLLQLIQQHDEKQAARAMDDTLSALRELFEKEQPAYDSIARTHVRQAGQVAKDLTNAGGVDSTPMLAPALKPFDLTPLPASSSLQTSLKSLAISRLESRTAELAHREEIASVAMLEGLREMSSRVHLLATEKPMPIRGNPFSLKLVEAWAESWSASLI